MLMLNGERLKKLSKRLWHIRRITQAVFGLAMAVRERDPQEALGLFQKAVALG